MKKALAKIARQYGLSLIILFGSAAKKTTHAASDIDVAVVAKKTLTVGKELKMRAALSETLQGEIDLAFLNHASPLLLGQIARDGKLLFGGKKNFNAVRIQAMKQYIDFKPYFELRARAVRKQIASYA